MLVFLCDECHGPLRPEEYREQTALGAVRHLCRTCLEKKASSIFPAPSVQSPPVLPAAPVQESRRPREPVHSGPRDKTPNERPAPDQRAAADQCRDCQVAQTRGTAQGQAAPDSSNPFCATCEKASSVPGMKFRCHVCRSVVEIEEVKAGSALVLDEKVFCSTCRRRAHGVTPDQPLKAVARPAPDRPQAPTSRVPEKTRAATAHQHEDSPDPGQGGPLQCDMCSRTFSLEDLRSGRAEIRDARVLCPRCIAKIDRKRERFDLRFIASLAFIIVVFPIGAAGLAFFAIQGGFSPLKGGGAASGKTGDAGAHSAGPAEKPADRQPAASAPKPLPADAPGTQKPPAPAPAEDKVRGIPRDALDQIISNLRSAPAQQPALPDPGSAFPESGAPDQGRDPALLLPMAASPDPAVRLEGILRLSSTSCDDDVFLKAVSDRDPFVRSAAAVALARRKKEAAVAPLLDLIRDPDPAVRRTASQALLDAVNVNVRFVEDFSREDLEKLRDRLDRALERKGGGK